MTDITLLPVKYACDMTQREYEEHKYLKAQIPEKHARDMTREEYRAECRRMDKAAYALHAWRQNDKIMSQLEAKKDNAR